MVSARAHPSNTKQKNALNSKSDANARRPTDAIEEVKGSVGLSAWDRAQEVTKKPKKNSSVAEVAVEDTDSDGMDCLVANESLQISTNDREGRKSPDIRRITKRASFVSMNNFKRHSNVRSFCSTKNGGAVPRAPKPQPSIHQQVSIRAQDLVSHNSSPVQDEMTVNMAIKGNGKRAALRVSKD